MYPRYNGNEFIVVELDSNMTLDESSIMLPLLVKKIKDLSEMVVTDLTATKYEKENVRNPPDA